MKAPVNDTAPAPAPVALPPEPLLLLKVQELARLMRVDRKTVYALIEAGDVPGVRRFGRAIRIHRQTAVDWLATGKKSAPQPARRA